MRSHNRLTDTPTSNKGYFLFVFGLAIDQDILQLNVAVQVFPGVEVLEALDDLDQNRDGLLQRESLAGLMDLMFEQIPPLAVLINNELIVLFCEKLIDFGDVRVAEAGEVGELLRKIV